MQNLLTKTELTSKISYVSVYISTTIFSDSSEVHFNTQSYLFANHSKQKLNNFKPQNLR